MTRVWILAFGALSTAGALAQTPTGVDTYAFRGFRLGGTVDELRTSLPYFTCRPSEKTNQADVECKADGGPSVMNYADQRSHAIVAEGFGDRVGAINLFFEACKYLALETSMSARFGTATGSYGMRSWRGRDTTVTLISRGGMCAVGYTHDAYQAERTSREQKAARSPTSGM